MICSKHFRDTIIKLNTILIVADRESFIQPRVHQSSKNLCASPKFKCQKVKMKKVPYHGSTNTRHHHGEFSCPGNWHRGFVGETSEPADRKGYYTHGSVHRESNLMTVQQDATYSVYYFSVGSSNCFGC